MSADNERKRQLTRQNQDLLMKAVEQGAPDGVSDVVCDNCGMPIVFRELGDTAWESSCECGKFNATFRGL